MPYESDDRGHTEGHNGLGCCLHLDHPSLAAISWATRERVTLLAASPEGVVVAGCTPEWDDAVARDLETRGPGGHRLPHTRNSDGHVVLPWGDGAR